MPRFFCVECRKPIPGEDLPDRGYTVAKIVAEPCGVLRRDQFGLPANYYGRVSGYLVKSGCSHRECEQYHGDRS